MLKEMTFVCLYKNDKNRIVLILIIHRLNNNRLYFFKIKTFRDKREVNQGANKKLQRKKQKNQLKNKPKKYKFNNKIVK